MMRQNKLFTSIYVAGTGLSIAFTMVLFIIYYVKFAPIYPEYNRNRTLVINNMAVGKKGSEQWNSCNPGVNLRVLELVKDLPHLDKVGLAAMTDWAGGRTVVIPSTKQLYPVHSGRVDCGFWQVFEFRFLSGRPFTEAEVESNLPVAILSESLAKRIFASTDVEGEHFIFNGADTKVAGVVADVSGATPATAADIYLPLFYGDEGRLSVDDYGLLGQFSVYMLAASRDDLETLRAEVQDVFNRYNQEDEYLSNNLMEQPDVWWKNTFRDNCSSVPDIAAALRSILYMLLALLFIPAMNLCGMISSRMDERLSELGVRKAYGATNAELVTQVLTENLLLTLMGGLLGLALAYVIAVSGSGWILYLFEDSVRQNSVSPSFTVEMLFNPTLFLIVLGLCLLLNVISALVPTVLALRRPIINSIVSKR